MPLTREMMIQAVMLSGEVAEELKQHEFRARTNNTHMYYQVDNPI